jgi:nicotinate-nucleotide adenylyltransferase
MPRPEIALFGTSADPPTAAHQRILEGLALRFDQVAVWAADNPFKPGQTPLEHRQAMLDLLVKQIQGKAANVGLYPELSNWRTRLSVEVARSRWPEANLTLVVGADVVATMSHWYRVQELWPLVKLLIIARSGVPVRAADLAELKAQGARWAIADFTLPQISSTAYRERGNTEGLTPEIVNYIHRQSLYPWANANQIPLPKSLPNPPG